LLDWLPLILALISAPIAVGIYSLQKWMDRRNDLVNTKRREYQDFLVNVCKHLAQIVILIDAAKNKDRDSTGAIESQFRDTRDSLAAQQMKLACIGSDEVIRQMSHFFENLKDVHLSVENKKLQLQIVSRMVLAMRRDCFKDTRLNIEEIEKALPFRVEA